MATHNAILKNGVYLQNTHITSIVARSRIQTFIPNQCYGIEVLPDGAICKLSMHFHEYQSKLLE